MSAGGAASADVVVIGAGIVGAACARELAVRGVRVTLIDRGDVAGGTTGLGEGNVLASDKDAGPELELTIAGLAVYDEIDARLGAEAQIRRKGALIVHPEASTWAGEPERVARLQAAGVDCALLAGDAVREREPLLTGAVHGASFFPGDLQCAPRAIARALAREAAAAGAELRTGCTVEAIVVDRARRVGAPGFKAAGGSPRAPSCSPPGHGAARWPRAPASTCRSSRAGVSSSASPHRT